MLDHSSTLYLEGLVFGVIVVLVVASVTLMRICAKGQDKRLVRLRSFSIGDAGCSVEADRVPVYENMKTMLEAQGLLETGLPMEAALRLFDDLVRHELPQHIHASGVHLHHCFAISLSFFGRALDGLASDIAGGASLRITATRFVNNLHVAAFLVPMLALTAHWFSSRCLHLSLCANVFYIIWMVLLECVIVFVWSSLHGFLLQMGQEQEFFLVALVALDSVEVAVILVVVVFQGDLLRCSRFRHVDSMMSSNLPVPHRSRRHDR